MKRAKGFSVRSNVMSMKQSKNFYVRPCAHYITLQDDVMVITGSKTEGGGSEDQELSKENFSADECETDPTGHDVWSSWESDEK